LTIHHKCGIITCSEMMTHCADLTRAETNLPVDSDSKLRYDPRLQLV